MDQPDDIPEAQSGGNLNSPKVGTGQSTPESMDTEEVKQSTPMVTGHSSGSIASSLGTGSSMEHEGSHDCVSPKSVSLSITCSDETSFPATENSENNADISGLLESRTSGAGFVVQDPTESEGELEEGAMTAVTLQKSTLSDKKDDESSQAFREDEDEGRLSVTQSAKESEKMDTENAEDVIDKVKNETGLSDGDGIDRDKMLSWLAALVRTWPCFSAIALCVCTTDREVVEKLEELLALCIAESAEFYKETEKVVDKGFFGNLTAATKRVSFLRFFKAEPQGIDEEGLSKFLENKFKAEKEILFQSLINARSGKTDFDTECQNDIKKLKDAVEKRKRLERDVKDRVTEIIKNFDDHQFSDFSDALKSKVSPEDAKKEQYINMFLKENADTESDVPLNSTEKLVWFKNFGAALSPKVLGAEESVKKPIKKFKDQKNRVERFETDFKTAVTTLLSQLGDKDFVKHVLNAFDQNDVEQCYTTLYTYSCEFSEQKEWEDCQRKWKLLKQGLDNLEKCFKSALSQFTSENRKKIKTALWKKIPDYYKQIVKFETESSGSENITPELIKILLDEKTAKDICYEAVSAMAPLLNPDDPFAKAQKLDAEVKSKAITMLKNFDGTFFKAVKTELITDAIHTASVPNMALCDELEAKGASLREVCPGYDDGNARNLIVIRNNVVHVLFQFENDDQRDRYLEGLKGFTKATGKKMNEDIVLVGGSKEALGYIKYCMSLIKDEGGKSKEDLRKLEWQVKKLDKVCKSRKKIIKEKEAEVRRLQASKRKLLTAITTIGEEARKILRLCEEQLIV